MRSRLLGAALFALALCARAAIAQDQPITREEYNRLQNTVNRMQQEIDALKKDKAAQQAQLDQMKKGQVSQEDMDKIIDDIQKDIRDNRSLLGSLKHGTTKLVIAGDADAGFTARQHENSNFEATFAPLFLWQINEKILFEGGLDISVERNDANENETAVDLTLANMSYLVNNNLVLTGGLFVVPFGVHHLHFDPPWINKLPDDPLPFGDGGIAPSSELGAMASGAFMIAGTRMTYAVYVTNGPGLITDDPDAAGMLDFDNFTDLNNDKAIGGRLSWLPVREFEIGASIMRASVNPDGFDKNVNALLWAVDANYTKELDWLKGQLNLRAEWVWNNVEDVTYHPTGSPPLRFDNNRNGGYVQIAYRPTMADSKIIRNFEFPVRYDRLEASLDAPGGDREQRVTIGIDYWLAPNAVLKVAYQIDDKEVGEDQNAFLMQFGLGL